MQLNNGKVVAFHPSIGRLASIFRCINFILFSNLFRLDECNAIANWFYFGIDYHHSDYFIQRENKNETTRRTIYHLCTNTATPSLGLSHTSPFKIKYVCLLKHSMCICLFVCVCVCDVKLKIIDVIPI